MRSARHHRHRQELAAWELRLTRRAAALKLLATIVGAVGLIAAVATGLATGAAGPTLLAASPLLVSAGAAAIATAVDDRVRRIQLVRIALGDRAEPDGLDQARRLATAATLAGVVAAALAIAGVIGSAVAFRASDAAAVHALVTAPFPLAVIAGAMSFRLRRLAWAAAGARGRAEGGRDALRPA